MKNNFKKIVFGDSLKMRFSVVIPFLIGIRKVCPCWSRKVLYTFLDHKVFIFFLVLYLLPLKLPAADTSSFGDSKITISMDFQDANLKDVVKILSIQSGLNFIASEAVQDRKITLFLDKVPIKETMDKLFKANNLTYELDEQAKIFIVKDWGKPEIDTITKVFYLKYATVSSSSLKEEMYNQISSAGTTSGGGSTTGSSTSGESGKWTSEKDVGITNAVKKNLTPNIGFVIEDYRTNSLIVIDIPNRMPVIEKLIASLDVPASQVMLEVEMLDVSKNTVDKIGLEFGQSPFTFVVPGNRHVETFIGDITYRSLSLPGAAGAVVFGHTYAEVLDFLRTRTDTKFLARPRLLTLNNETAEIKITTQESVGVTTTSTATTSTTTATPERAETGVLLRITPQINVDTGEITMFIYPQVSEATAGNTLTSGSQSFRYRDPEVRSTKSVVRIRDNQTVLIGGLIRNEFTQVVTKVPILGDIPIVGALFRHKGGDSDKNKERELIIFITPHIIKDTNVEFAQAKKTGLATKEQITILPSERRLAIDASLNNFEKVK